jgi:hypothetical protein
VLRVEQRPAGGPVYRTAFSLQALELGSQRVIGTPEEGGGRFPHGEQNHLFLAPEGLVYGGGYIVQHSKRVTLNVCSDTGRQFNVPAILTNRI